MRRPTFNQIRAGALFTGGMAGVAYVTIVEQADRPTLLILFGAMLGLPLFLQADERRRLPPEPPQHPPPPVPPTVRTPEGPDDS